MLCSFRESINHWENTCIRCQKKNRVIEINHAAHLLISKCFASRACVQDTFLFHILLIVTLLSPFPAIDVANSFLVIPQCFSMRLLIRKSPRDLRINGETAATASMRAVRADSWLRLTIR